MASWVSGTLITEPTPVPTFDGLFLTAVAAYGSSALAVSGGDLCVWAKHSTTTLPLYTLRADFLGLQKRRRRLSHG